MKTILNNRPKAYSYIRFSTPEQLHGDSLRRQIEASERYAKENNLVLDTQLNFRDLGISAYHGKHRKEGALSEFLRLVEKGEIKRGSILIVENLDRLSREQPIVALQQFISIIQAGITLVTLGDRQKYTSESLNKDISQLYLSIGEMVRANKESERKSELLSAAWENKRKQIKDKGTIITARCPAWLHLSKDKTRFIKNKEACKAITAIYELRLAGHGALRIEREMNQSNLWKPPKRGKNIVGGWRKSYIVKILNSPAVIGIYQPHKIVNGKREPVGEPIRDYYPKIIPDKLFYQVQSIREANKELKGHGGGKTGKASNLFPYVAVCGQCGSTMQFVDKGKGNTYLKCSTSKRKLTENGKPVCTAKAIEYKEFEKLIFKNLEELNLSDILPNSNAIKVQQKTIAQQVTAYQQKLKLDVLMIKNLTDSIATNKDKRVRQALESRLKGIFDDKEQLIRDISSLNNESVKLEQSLKQINESINVVNDVYKLLSKPRDKNKLIELRLHLRSEIRKIIKQIKVYPLQEKYQEITDMSDIEPGLYKIMHSKYIDHVRITFNANKNVRHLYLKSMVIPEF